MTCRYAGPDRPRALKRRHGDDCPATPTYDHKGRLQPAPECDGCEPCPETHCRDCGWRHALSTCAECVRESREALDEIERLSARCLGEAVVKGINSTAAMLAGPVVDPDRFGRRLALAIDNRNCRCALKGPSWRDRRGRMPSDPEHPLDCPDAAAYVHDNRDEKAPLFVLGRLDIEVMEHLGHERTRRVTVARAADYLRSNLTHLAADMEFPFPELRAELMACQSYLEEVLRDGERETEGARCPSCRKARLVRRFGAELSGKADWWTCPRDACAQAWTVAEYDRWVSEDYRAHAKALCAADILAQYRVAPSTLRTWAQRSQVTKRGRDASGRMLYDVADVLACRDSVNYAETDAGAE